MKNILTTVATLAMLTTTAQANVLGTYLRDDVEPVTAHIKEGLLYCTRVSDGYELCNGMTEQADGSWHGEKLKNPDMPGFMKFAGTITFEEGQMLLEGCTMGGKVCKSKTWPMQP